MSKFNLLRAFAKRHSQVAARLRYPKVAIREV